MREALESQDQKLWEEALKSEQHAIIKNHTFSLVERPRGQQVLRRKYVLKVKRRHNGNVDKQKVRLVIMGNMQEGGVYYDETFAPVMKYQSLNLSFSFSLRLFKYAIVLLTQRCSLVCQLSSLLVKLIFRHPIWEGCTIYPMASQILHDYKLGNLP